MWEPDSVPVEGQLGQAMRMLQQVIHDGLQHGFFEYGVTCELIPGRKRRLVIKAGTSHQFTILEDELRP